MKENEVMTPYRLFFQVKDSFLHITGSIWPHISSHNSTDLGQRLVVVRHV